MSRANMTMGQIQELVENPGQPVRQPAVAILTIDTADRINPETSIVNRIYINKQQTLMDGFFTRIALTEVNYTWDIPNVNTYNNTLTASGAYGVITVSLPVGFYTPTELAAAVVVALEAAAEEADPGGLGGTFTCDYDSDRRSFTIGNGGSAFLLIPKPKGADLSYIMGLQNPGEVEDVVLSYTGSYAPMIYTPYFDIVSQQLTKKQNVKDNSTSINTGQNLLARIYLTPEGLVKATPTDESDIVGCRPFTYYKEFQNPKQIFWDTKEFINVVDLSLIDKWGNLLLETPNVEERDNESEPTLITQYYFGTGYTNFQLTLQITET